jgi:hypothetical protein
MSLQTVLNDHRATLTCDTRYGYVHQTLKQPLRGLALQEVLDTTLSTISENRVIKWLADERKAIELSDEDMDFVVKDWAPRAVRAGWRFMALVVPTDAKGRAAMQKMVMAFHEMGVQVRTFTSPDEAREWLLEVR